MKKFLRKILQACGLLSLYHFAWAYLTSLIYGRPSRYLVVIGVTGTKGKSTIIELINAVLEAAGAKTILSSSTRFKLVKESHPNLTGNTMPGRGFLQKFLHQGVRQGAQYALIEVVSEGVVQHRHRFIDFDMAVFANLHPEHIESHGSFAQYRAAKLKFFRDVRKFSRKKNKKFFINQNDPNAAYFIEAAGDEEVILCSKTNIPLKIAGEFNRENAGLAEAVTRSLGIEEEIIRRTIANFGGVPGRMEFVQEEPFRVVIDYAHTPHSLAAVYQTLASADKQRRGLICVLGSAGGGRDRWKRPKMGEIASRYCQTIILTDEDPFDEDPEKIIEEIAAGIPSSSPAKVMKILDRRRAIETAIALASPGETVIVTGKGSEPYLRVAKGRRLPWSDRQIAEEALARRK